MIVTVSEHALERYRQHHPNASDGEVEWAIEYAIEIDRETARAITGRSTGPHPKEQEGKNHYFLAYDRRGLFVLVSRNLSFRTSWFVVTYLRFQENQRCFAEEK